MGYRSDVAVVLKREVYDALMEEALKDPKNFKYALLVHEDGSSAIGKLKFEGNYAVLYWESVKWYPEYRAVQLIESTLKSKDGYFVRIGESNSDAVAQLYGDDSEMEALVYIYRSIEI